MKNKNSLKLALKTISTLPNSNYLTSVLSMNPGLNSKIIKNFPMVLWDWYSICARNKNIMNIINDASLYSFIDYTALSYNRYLDIRFIIDNIDKPWNWYEGLSNNPFIIKEVNLISDDLKYDIIRICSAPPNTIKIFPNGGPLFYEAWHNFKNIV
jgi:hypothetical protein